MKIFWWDDRNPLVLPSLWIHDSESMTTLEIHDPRQELPGLIQRGFAEVTVRTAHELGVRR